MLQNLMADKHVALNGERDGNLDSPEWEMEYGK